MGQHDDPRSSINDVGTDSALGGARYAAGAFQGTGPRFASLAEILKYVDHAKPAGCKGQLLVDAQRMVKSEIGEKSSLRDQYLSRPLAVAKSLIKKRVRWRYLDLYEKRATRQQHESRGGKKLHHSQASRLELRRKTREEQADLFESLLNYAESVGIDRDDLWDFWMHAQFGVTFAEIGAKRGITGPMASYRFYRTKRKLIPFGEKLSL